MSTPAAPPDLDDTIAALRLACQDLSVPNSDLPSTLPAAYTSTSAVLRRFFFALAASGQVDINSGGTFSQRAWEGALAEQARRAIVAVKAAKEEAAKEAGDKDLPRKVLEAEMEIVRGKERSLRTVAEATVAGFA